MVEDELPILFSIDSLESSIYQIYISNKEVNRDKDLLLKRISEFEKKFEDYKKQVSTHYKYKTQAITILEKKFSELKTAILNSDNNAFILEKDLLDHIQKLKQDWHHHIENTKSRQARHSENYKAILLIFTLFASLLIIFMGHYIRHTDRKWKNSQLRLMDNSRLASLGEMAGGIAHEINNPLTIIKMRAVSLRKKFAKGEMDEKSFTSGMDNIDETVGRISKIIKGLKNLAHGKVEDVDVLKIKEVFETVQSVCDDKMRSKGIHYKVNYDEEPFNQLVRCSTVQLSQVILNLLKNSIDAIEESQAIEEDRWISIDTAIRNNRIYFYFNDSGPGIPEKHKAKIFDPFFTTKPVGKGTGLGMPICKSIVEQHGGTLTLAEERLKDGNFIMELPIVTADELFADDDEGPVIQ